MTRAYSYHARDRLSSIRKWKNTILQVFAPTEPNIDGISIIPEVIRGNGEVRDGAIPRRILDRESRGLQIYFL